MPAAIPRRFGTTLLIPLAATLASGSMCPAVATTIIVDDFTAGTADLNITAAAPPEQSATNLETGLTGVLGGSREFTIRKTSGSSGSSRNVAGAVDSEAGELLYVSGNATGSMTLRYDANATGLNLSLNPDRLLPDRVVNRLHAQRYHDRPGTVHLRPRCDGDRVCRVAPAPPPPCRPEGRLIAL
jgi:hypothetical protein